MLLGARVLFSGKQGGGWVNPYVTDGLVVMWDAEWNAGGGKHDANATEWKDIAGVYNLHLPMRDHLIEDNGVRIMSSLAMRTESPVELSQDLFGGYSAEVRFTLPDILPDEDSPYRYIFGLRYQNFLKYYNEERLNSGWSNNYGGVGTAIGAGRGYIYAVRFGVATLAALKGTHSLAGDIVNQSTTLYANSLPVVTEPTAAMIGTENAQMTCIAINGIGRSSDSVFETGLPGMIVHSVRLYNRALTAEEVAHNYAVDQQRFGV